VCLLVFLRAYGYVCISAYMCTVYVYVPVYVCVCLCMCLRVHLRVRPCVYVFIFVCERGGESAREKGYL